MSQEISGAWQDVLACEIRTKSPHRQPARVALLLRVGKILRQAGLFSRKNARTKPGESHESPADAYRALAKHTSLIAYWKARYQSSAYRAAPHS